MASAALLGVSQSMAFVRLRHVSWQHNDLEPNFRDAEPPSFPPLPLAFRSAELRVESFQRSGVSDRNEAAARDVQEFIGCLSCAGVLAMSAGFV